MFPTVRQKLGGLGAKRIGVTVYRLLPTPSTAIDLWITHSTNEYLQTSLPLLTEFLAAFYA